MNKIKTVWCLENKYSKFGAQDLFWSGALFPLLVFHWPFRLVPQTALGRQRPMEQRVAIEYVTISETLRGSSSVLGPSRTLFSFLHVNLTMLSELGEILFWMCATFPHLHGECMLSLHVTFLHLHGECMLMPHPCCSDRCVLTSEVWPCHIREVTMAESVPGPGKWKHRTWLKPYSQADT